MSRTYSRGRRALVTAAALAGLALIGVVAGCGGGGGSKGTKTTPAPVDQVVNGTGYTFAAPARWRILTTSHGVSVSGARWQLLTVGVYKLVKPYAPTRFEATARELDGVAASLAAGR